MSFLSEGQRGGLEKAVQRARDIAEDGARAAVMQLAVHNSEPFSNLSPEERDLRNRLRARARQLGDTRNAKSGQHGIEHLVAEVAYEHWHRMLFARFLAENSVLMHPDGVPVTLDECEELATEEGAADGWELASKYAERMLPQIFRPGSPVFELKLPPEKVRELEHLLADLPPNTFTASDSLGWVYQFWQTKKKDAVNKSEVKIGADELPAVTQLFTEPYMVQFLLHNTLGAWWVGRNGHDSLPVEMPYLRLLDNGTPAAGTFDSWPKATAELAILDPCCGSGHFLVAAFDILVRFRMQEEHIDAATAGDAVLRDNLHGLEIDERCTQIAAFALALRAWTYEGSGGYRALPEMQIACSGSAPRSKKTEWVALAGDDLRMRNGMESLYELFKQAPVLGSLINPTKVGFVGDQQELGVARFDQLKLLLDAEVESNASNRDAQRRELGVAAQGIVAAARLLGRSFTLVVTNVPYLTRTNQCPALQHYCESHHESARHDLATAFLERCISFCASAGTCSLVLPQNWLFLSRYQQFRTTLLKTTRWAVLARLGAGAFETISGEVVKAILAIMVHSVPSDDSDLLAIDVSSSSGAKQKALHLREYPGNTISQSQQLRNPDSRVVLEARSLHALLSEYASSHQGIKTCDDPRFVAFFWEMPSILEGWERYQSTVPQTTHYSGMERVVRYEDGRGGMRRLAASQTRDRRRDRQGINAWGKQGVVVSCIGELPATLYTGVKFDTNVSVVVPDSPSDLAAIWSFCSSAGYHQAVRKIDQKLNVTHGTFVKVPFDLQHWREVATNAYPDGLPTPYSDTPTQWIFRGAIRRATAPLQVAVARLVGYSWPKREDDELDELVDDDGIVCLPAVRGEQPAATRLQRVLARAFGAEWSAHKQAELLSCCDCKGWTLDRWLSDKFFTQHCSLFLQRPFIWHVWDGLKKGGFSALVNYHKLNRNLLETLTYNYLGDWIRRQRDDEKRGVEGASERLRFAEALLDKLKLILKGEKPYDIFVRWKPIEEQPIGWEPDINDGVRVNIRPFMVVGDVGKKGAGILRDRPNVKWGKDRGSDPADAPWYELGPTYKGKKGDRINEHHLTLAEKQAARDAAGGKP